MKKKFKRLVFSASILLIFLVLLLVNFHSAQLTVAATSITNPAVWGISAAELEVAKSLNAELCSTTGQPGAYDWCVGGKVVGLHSLGASQAPATPAAKGFASFLSSIWGWLVGLFDATPFFSVAGADFVEIGKNYVYTISLTTSPPDHFFNDGTYQTQYAYWAVVDETQKVIVGDVAGVEVNGSFSKNVSFMPSKSGKYVLTAFITQIDSTYNSASGLWSYGNETIVVKEAKNIASQVTFTAPVIPSAGGFGSFLQAIFLWIKNLFGWLF